jgi:dihydropyrimidine dehydrogenase (NAD+) subunit PreA
VRAGLDKPIEIPSIQETIIQTAAELGAAPSFAEPNPLNGKKVAVIGAGPTGLTAAFTLSKLGYKVEIFEREGKPGGAANLIPEHRLPRHILDNDLSFLLSSRRINLHLNSPVTKLEKLQGFDATLIAVGLTEPIHLGIGGESNAIYGWDYLSHPDKFALHGPVAIIGGGAVACDCAVIARHQGVERVEIFSLEKLSELPLPQRERQDLLDMGIHVNGRTRITEIIPNNIGISGIKTIRIAYPPGDQPHQANSPKTAFDVKAVVDMPGTEQTRADIRHVIIAIGHRSSLPTTNGYFVAGDCTHGPSSIVEAVASGKNAAAAIHAKLSQTTHNPSTNPRKSVVTIPGYNEHPVSLKTEFFGREIRSPFLLSAAPPTDGYEQMKRAFQAGWAGGIMKTAFDNVPIHIPSEYMYTFNSRTWGNCDNVSGHSLDRVCREIEQLVKEFPQHLILASTGGPVSGDDQSDAAVWQSNTRKLEAAGAMGIEYSLSCPQGGDGTEGDIVSQSPALTAKIIDWILQTGNPDIPKLFKLTAAVTSIALIAQAIKEVLERYPNAKAGITLANTFPTLAFRPNPSGKWDEGVVVGMSGEGVLPISNLTLANVSHLGLHVSGNGGPMDYKAAAHFLALGVHTVQFCTIAMKYGYDIVQELESGLSHLMQQRGIKSVADLIGIARPKPITGFMDLSPIKKISSVQPELCIHCGNCTRCSYFAIALDEQLYPVTNPEHCVGCSICARECPSGALVMRERTAQELAALKEH